jgi:hypothetical protein
MGQHRRVNTGTYQLLAKKSQSPFNPNELRALQNQGSGRAAPSLWDGSERVLSLSVGGEARNLGLFV